MKERAQKQFVLQKIPKIPHDATKKGETQSKPVEEMTLEEENFYSIWEFETATETTPAVETI